MRIAVVHSFYSQTQPSGENVAVDSQVRALRDAGHEVRLIARDTDDLANSPLYRFKAAATVASGHGQAPTAALEDFQPDVVHVHNLFPNFGTAWLDSWRGPLIATLHNFRPMCSAGTLLRDGRHCTLCPDGSSWSAVRHACYRSSHLASVPLAIATRQAPERHPLLRRADALICVSLRAADTYSHYIPSRRIAYVPNFVDQPAEPPQAAPRHKTWLYVGRLTREKGITELLDVWPDGERLDIIGAGPLEDAVRARSGQFVRFIGPMSHKETLARMRAYEGLIIPSIWAEAGVTMVLIESLSQGVPVIAARGNSAADEVERRSVGAVFELGRSEELPRALSKVRNDPTLRARCLKMSRDFSASAWLKRIQPIYSRVSAE